MCHLYVNESYSLSFSYIQQWTDIQCRQEMKDKSYRSQVAGLV